MESTIEFRGEKKFIGSKIRMSLSCNKTHVLWGSFMPQKNQIKNSVGSELFSIEVYSEHYFDFFKPENEFEKWAAVEVTDFDTLPEGMLTLTIPEGLYAVFLHQGPASDGFLTYQAIFEIWLPKSDYNLDYRPHFAIMGEKYKRDEADSEEEIWIPVRSKE